ncbi:ComEA family DNA-binding protein [Geodermatophilus obscurus]|uniref:Competence protein ComEA helix-hairpin-helix repeat protein n=1 Tax=Geodermatophilus obscurus (strain ATCC 25078 / DSM 43160 / JCM 3152 / CCUG 61914 / KCC A-0152 / KCTC 9177 / NBRC 13315 / NRRL B-3577 / G-20) TaxID=526225 RepID=D2SCU5_GEOOG|nr:ComEA family DNA-binding protein [Geodermatophilus obscurus]ADB74330.1 competence protein ComEA helix-hairpin-helix repeat protein [Geodermatophilus obscurus DSM 43160]
MRLSSRRSDDADLIRERLRVLLDERRPPGWVPGDEALHAEEEEEDAVAAADDGLPAGIGRHRVPDSAVRVAPGRRAAWSLWVVGLLAALLVLGSTWSGRPQVEPAPVEPAPVESPAASPAAESPAATSAGIAADSAATVVVSVVGSVARPGLVTLPEGARVADAVTAAGGLLPDADPASINLAAVVSDGQQVAVGVPGAAAAGGTVGGTDATSGAGPVDLNAATAPDLDALPGIGPVLAQRIVEHRERNGPFRTVEQLDDVPGIGPTTYAELAELVTV